jgi:hypothetical protein
MEIQRILLQDQGITEKTGVGMWKGWKISESKEDFSNIIQQIKYIQEDHRRDGKIDY